MISLYAKGLTTGEIQAHLVEIYGTEVSHETTSTITDEIVADMAVWQNRPLDAVYAVWLIDAITVTTATHQINTPRPQRRSRRSPLRCPRRRLGTHLPCDDPQPATVLQRVHPVAGGPRRTAPPTPAGASTPGSQEPHSWLT